MKKQDKRRRTKSSPKPKRFLLYSIALIAAVLTIAAVTVIARQVASGKSVKASEKTAAVTEHAPANSGRQYVTVKVAGRDVQVDSQTGAIRPLTAQEAKELADGLKVMLNRSTDGLVKVKHADGSVSMDLEGRFQNVAIARVNEDGSLSQSCIDNPQAAASFFGIDPQLLQDGPGKTVPQPVRKSAPTSSFK